MAYQNVGTPRFYINDALWATSLGRALGYSSLPASVLQMNPSNQLFRDIDTQHWITVPTPAGFNYVAVLGHSGLSDSDCAIYAIDVTDTATIGGVSPALENDVNVNMDNMEDAPEYDGWSLMTTELNTSLPSDPMSSWMTEVMLNGGGTLAYPDGNPDFHISVGCISIGRYFDMPHSPDLSLSMTREYGGIKTIETKGGASLSNSFYTKPPMWGGLGSWELYGLSDNSQAYNLVPQELARSGRRIWDLSFSYLQDSDVWGPNQSTGQWHWGTTVGSRDLYGDDIADSVQGNEYAFAYDILSDDSFYSQVIHKTSGGQLPFIFQPNKDDTTVFAICKLDMKSFKFEQVANGVYNVNLKIREVW